MGNALIEKIQFYFLYIWKRIRDSKIRTKLTVYLVLVALICSGIIGDISYMTMKDSLIATARESAISLLKQVGIRMEERIREFQDISYSFACRQEIYELLDDEEDMEMNQWEYAMNQAALTSTFFQFNMLHNYSDFVIMESKHANIYYYDQKEKREKITSVDASKIMDRLRGCVTETAPIRWIQEGDQIYFVRRLVRLGEGGKMQTSGTLVFAVSGAFFELKEDETRYVSNENIIVAGEDGAIYKNNRIGMEEEALQRYFSYQDGKYYIYATMQEIGGEKYLVVPMRTIRFKWNILCCIPYGSILEEANKVIPKIFVTTISLLAVCLLIGFGLYRMLRKNLKVIEQGMRQYETGDYTSRLSPAVYDEIGMLILQFNHMGLKINELNELTRKEEEEKEQLRYQVMEAQINPHFLYNTLSSLKWLAYEKGEEEIAKLADAIIRLLRFTVKNASRIILLKEELEYIRHYSYIQQTRYGDAFHVEFGVTGEAEQFPVTGFILQPFVENSILHGLDIAKPEGVIWIKGEVADGKLLLTVSDNGSGIPSEKLMDIQKKIEEKKSEKYSGFNGIGITSIILRLKMVYGEDFRYRIESEPESGTSITLIIPERIPENEEESINRRG
ncbi:MAG TPA: histidine kinase [Clostridiales bacterium]|nr:histidine kinase [Clostridiales bacterium]